MLEIENFVVLFLVKDSIIFVTHMHFSLTFSLHSRINQNKSLAENNVGIFKIDPNLQYFYVLKYISKYCIM